MNTKELAGAYREFFKGALGQDLISRVTELRAKQVDEAVASGDTVPLNKAAGIDLVLLEFNKVTSMDQIGGGRK